MNASIRTLWVVGAIGVLTVGAWAGNAGGVRQLPFKPADPTLAFKFGGQSKVVVMKDLAAVEALLPKDEAKALAASVDFKKEQIVLVSWTTSGPPEGTLKHEVKGTGADRQVIFFVQAPPAANARGQRARIGADFFATPAGVAVSFEPAERR